MVSLLGSSSAMPKVEPWAYWIRVFISQDPQMIQVPLRNAALHLQRGRYFSLLFSFYGWGNWGLRKFLKMTKATEWVRRDGTQSLQECDSRAYPQCCRPSPPWMQVGFTLLGSVVGIERSKRQQGGYKLLSLVMHWETDGPSQNWNETDLSHSSIFAWFWIIGIWYFWVSKSGRRQHRSWDLESLELEIYFIC